MSSESRLSWEFEYWDGVGSGGGRALPCPAVRGLFLIIDQVDAKMGCIRNLLKTCVVLHDCIHDYATLVSIHVAFQTLTFSPILDPNPDCRSLDSEL